MRVRRRHAPLVGEDYVPALPPRVDARLLERRRQREEEGGEGASAQGDREGVAGRQRRPAGRDDGVREDLPDGRLGRRHEHAGAVRRGGGRGHDVVVRSVVVAVGCKVGSFSFGLGFLRE